MFWDFFSQSYKLPLLVLKRAMANPMGVFVYGILSKWYILIMIATITVTFWVFKGLEKAGVLDAAEKEVRYGLLQAQAIAQRCVPLIVDLPKMWDCIEQTSGDQYIPNEDETTLRHDLERDLKDSNNNNNRSHPVQQDAGHPYDSNDNPYDNDNSNTSYDDGLIRSK